MSQFPDYYKILNIPKSATQDEVRQAYKKESLRTHPDRLVNAAPSERQRATERFQVAYTVAIAKHQLTGDTLFSKAVADAYYVLSDKTRRREYDVLYSTRANNARTDDPSSSSSFFSQFASMFTGGSAGNNGADAGQAGTGARPDAEGVFADVFEELLRPEVNRVVPWWTYVGAVSGAGLGFIVANIPGLMVGAFAGNRLGAIRDAKGKSVAAVFSELGGEQRAEILRALAMKVLGSAL